MIKHGIDWAKLAIDINIERKKAIAKGIPSPDAFNVAYSSVVGQYPAITGELWIEGRRIVGGILAKWKKEKKKEVPAEKEKPARKRPVAPRASKKLYRRGQNKQQGELF